MEVIPIWPKLKILSLEIKVIGLEQRMYNR